MSHSSLPHPGTGPFPASHGLPTLSGRCAALATRPSPPRPLVPSSRDYTPPGRQQPRGAGPLDPHPSGDRFVHLARVAPFPPFSPVPRPRSNPLGCFAAQSHPSSRVYTPPGRQQPCGAGPLDPHPFGDRFVHIARVAPLPPPPLTPVPPPIAHGWAVLHSAPDAPIRGVFFVALSPLPQTLQSLAPGSPPDDPVRGLGPCSTPPRMLQSGASFCRILSFASDAPVRGTGLTPGRSSPGASALLHSAPVAPIRGVFLSYSLRCLGCSSRWHLVHPRTIQSGGLCRASFRPCCSIPGRLFIVSSPLPRMLQSVAPGSAPDDPVRGLGPCSTPPRLLQSGASFYRILSVAPDAPIRGVFLSYSLRCLGRSSPWHRVQARTIQSGG